MTATRQQQIDLASFLERKRLTVPMFLERYNINGSAEALQGFIRAGNWVLAPELQAEIERAQNKLLEASTSVLATKPDEVSEIIPTTPVTATAAADPVVEPKVAQKRPAKTKAMSPSSPKPTAE